jgi:glycosyltransferase involved in cell wall biosynthesis
LTAVTVDMLNSQVSLQQPLISIVLPVFNGRSKIRGTLHNLTSKLDHLAPEIFKLAGGQNLTEPARNSPYEIIVVNDGSSDDTKKVVEKLVKETSGIRLVSYDINMGKGHAIKEGVQVSKGRYIFFMDGDGEIGTDTLTKYLTSLATADIVVGSKNHRRSVVQAPASRKILSKLFQLFVRLMLGLKVGDTQVGLKAGKGDEFRRIFQYVTVDRYAFDAEMLAIATLLGLRIKELPVRISLKKSFKGKEIARMAFDVMGIAYRLRVSKWYQKTLG